VTKFNRLEPELSAQYTLQKMWDVNGCLLLCMFLADNCRQCGFLSITFCVNWSCLSLPKDWDCFSWDAHEKCRHDNYLYV